MPPDLRPPLHVYGPKVESPPFVGFTAPPGFPPTPAAPTLPATVPLCVTTSGTRKQYSPLPPAPMPCDPSLLFPPPPPPPPIIET